MLLIYKNFNLKFCQKIILEKNRYLKKLKNKLSKKKIHILFLLT